MEYEIDDFKYYPELKLLYRNEKPPPEIRGRFTIKGKNRSVEFRRHDLKWWETVNALTEITGKGYENIFIFEGEGFKVMLATVAKKKHKWGPRS